VSILIIACHFYGQGFQDDSNSNYPSYCTLADPQDRLIFHIIDCLSYIIVLLGIHLTMIVDDIINGTPKVFSLLIVV
jgi:hypothetical protein